MRKGSGKRGIFGYDKKRIKKLKRRKFSSDQGFIGYLVYYFLEKHC